MYGGEEYTGFWLGNLRKRDHLGDPVIDGRIISNMWGQNMDYLLESNRKKQLSSLLATYNLFYTVNFATGLQNKSSTAKDNIFLDDNRLRSSITSPLINALSDHDAELLTIKNIHTAKRKASLKQKTR